MSVIFMFYIETQRFIQIY